MKQKDELRGLFEPSDIVVGIVVALLGFLAQISQ